MKQPLPQTPSVHDRLIRAFLDSSCAVVLLDNKGERVFWNRAAEALLNNQDPKSHPLFRASVLQQVLAVTHWNRIELALAPEQMGIEQRVAIVIELPPGSNAPGTKGVASPQCSERLLLVAIPPQTTEQSSLADREEFLATAAHDLKNPISAIFSYADALLEIPSEKFSAARARDVIKKMRSIAARSIELVRNYQQLAELASFVRKSPQEPVDVNLVIKSVVEETFRDDPGAHTVRVFPSTVPSLVNVDKLPLSRIITNIFANALRYTPPGGTITLSAANAVATSNSVTITVHNTGSLIPAEELPKLFSRRYRGSTSTGTSGSGLGLYIVKGILDRLGGSIQVTSTEATGTTFTVTLPR